MLGFLHFSRKKGIKIALCFHSITLALICQVFWPLSATFAANGTENFHFSDYTVDFYLSQDEDKTSRLRVVEEFTAVFPNYNQNHGITRIIPYTNQDGKNLTMASDRHLDINVWHNGKIEQPHEIEHGEGYFKVYLGDADTYVRGEHTYRLQYEFENVITEFTEDGHSWQELYWDTNGNDWNQRFEQVTATVHFGSTEITAAYQGNPSCYVGRYGDKGQERCKITPINNGVKFQAKDLKSHENLTFTLEFQPGTFVVPERPNNYSAIIMFALAVVVSGLILLIYLKLFRDNRKAREFYKGYFVKPEYAPLANFTVAQMAENYLGSTPGSSQVATLLELAVTGKIELIKAETTNKRGKVSTSWKVKLRSLKLNSEQVTVLKILAGGKEALNINQEITIKNHTATSELIALGQSFRDNVKSANRKHGLIKIKTRTLKSGKTVTSDRTSPSGILVISAVALLIGEFFLLASVLDGATYTYTKLIGGWLLVFLSLALAFTIVIVSAVLSSKLAPYYTHTEEGLKLSRYLDGLKLYIKMAEADRIKFLQSVKGADTSHQGIVNLYEKLLPYAVIFKLEKSWLNELSRYYDYQDVHEPDWYIGVGAFSAHDFSHALASASSTISSSVTHSTTSNSSSGFSGGGGGGFSGGGGGGGGGGGW